MLFFQNFGRYIKKLLGKSKTYEFEVTTESNRLSSIATSCDLKTR